MSYISIENFSYCYPNGEQKSLNDINMKIEKGEIILLTGKSGSGKSTLAKALTGAVPNFYGGTVSGHIRVNGINLKDMSHKERAAVVTMVFQDPEKQLVMNKVHREVAFGLENIGVESGQIKRRVWESLQFTNIMDIADREINTLSGGQKQKVAIASALSYMPQVIILDEPTSQLDPTSAEEIVSTINKINEELGITIVIIEQRINKWFQIADRICIMEKGSLSFIGNKNQLFESNTDFSMFLPHYLRVVKEAGIKEMPRNFKACRSLLSHIIDRNRIQVMKVSKTPSVNKCSAVDIKRVTCKYGNFHAVRDMSINIRQGDRLAILGANGAGKSTLLKSIIGLTSFSGTIKAYEKDIKEMKTKELYKIIGYVSQNPNDYISKDTVFEELEFTLKNNNSLDIQAIDDTLSMLGILHLKHKNPRDVSGGERQRIAIASIMVMKPKILLLDEPTRGLDYDAKRALGMLLHSINNSGTTIILVTHDVDFAAEFCTSFLVMFNGEKVASGSREEVLSDGIYYSTSINKLFRDIDRGIFTLVEALEYINNSFSEKRHI